ncbi:dihydrofolate reductase [Candidatus Blochmanniella vafra str. BVAF]|uniref:dihydrofolate reductase n=1 Tax=Blochmanniella vafra (strain BVAF) TaxID=859654 RepID=E8Q5N5_BLOVB|nr:dihydrofolate reductase [Candidatus Blochmannia vafer]ADV33532.1 dihydrofolate reductase [Candidatus Blochmannia vafer str. BVAF]
MISLISILTINHVIGRKNIIPWYFSIDMNWFKYHTTNKPIIMGRKTFESIGKKSLSNRINIVLSNRLSNNNNEFNNVIFVDDPNKVLSLSLVNKSKEIMVIGGSALYKIFFPKCTRMYLTYINTVYNYGDKWFPSYKKGDWKVICDIYKTCKSSCNKTMYTLNFKIFDR